MPTFINKGRNCWVNFAPTLNYTIVIVIREGYLSVLHNYYYLLALLIIHSLRTSMGLQIFIPTCFPPLSMIGGVRPMTLTFPLTSPGPRPFSVPPKFSI